MTERDKHPGRYKGPSGKGNWPRKRAHQLTKDSSREATVLGDRKVSVRLLFRNSTHQVQKNQASWAQAFISHVRLFPCRT